MKSRHSLFNSKSAAATVSNSLPRSLNRVPTILPSIHRYASISLATSTLPLTVYRLAGFLQATPNARSVSQGQASDTLVSFRNRKKNLGLKSRLRTRLAARFLGALHGVRPAKMASSHRLVAVWAPHCGYAGCWGIILQEKRRIFKRRNLSKGEYLRD